DFNSLDICVPHPHSRLARAPAPPPPTCCRHMSCFLGLPFQSWVVQELALFGGCGKNWGEMRCFGDGPCLASLSGH
uniref:Uncharacterized protein n=2 Tax=Bos TaxID=9903 RepID=A0A4W2EF39_BOBOX